MLSNFLQLIVRRPPADPRAGFIEEVHVNPRRAPRSARVGKLLLVGWVLILAKSWLLIWAVEKYHVPINPLWVIIPTVVFGFVCTLVYFKGE
jgi:hypothetical protein